MKRKKAGERDMDVARGTVLIVDSDESVRSSISRELAAKGLDCVTAGGREAVETASTQGFDLLIMGPGRSEVSEVEIIAQIVAAHPETGVVMADAGTESRVTAKTTKRSKHTYVPEGIDLDALGSRVEKAIEKKRSRSGSEDSRHREVESALQKAAHDLGERVKELNCLYAISELAGKQDISLEEILRGTVQLLPPGWQYPEITAGRIVLGDCGFTTDNFEESRWKQQCDIDAHGERVGVIEVCYLEEMPTIDEGPFLKEERNLINALAAQVGRIVERKWAEEALAGHRDILEKKVAERTTELGNANEQLRQEILERKQAEDETRIFKTIAVDANYGIAISDMEGNVVFANRAFAELHGYSPEEFVGKHFSVCHSEEQMESIGRLNEQLMLTGSIVGAETWHTRRDGSAFPILMNAMLIRDAEGETQHMAATALDITERKAAEEALRESEQKYRSMFDNMLDGFGFQEVVLDRDGTPVDYVFLEVNDRFEQYTGLKREDIIGRRISDVVPGIRDADPDLISIYGQVALTGETAQFSIYFEPFDKHYFVSVYGPRRGFFVTLFQDITERKHAEDELKQHREYLETLVRNRTSELSQAKEKLQLEIAERKEAQEALEAVYEEERQLRQQLEAEFSRRVEFTRTLAHELKTPLASVLASSDLLSAQLRDETLLGLARGVNRSASNLSGRIDEFLDLAKGEMGTLEVNLQSLDILPLLHDLAEEFAPLASSHGQTLTADLSPSLPEVRGDAARLRQVVSNLVGNAVKFTPKGGKITMRAMEKEGALVVEIQDSGRGLSIDEQERLFQPYYRVESDRAHFAGMGLGLALCKRLVELHGGQIWVRSQVGVGSTFGFSLPLEAVAAKAAHAEAGNKRWKVLMIDDDSEMANSVSLAFRLLWPEAEVITAGWGEEGIEMVETESPDAVMLDLGLPDQDGLDVLKQIRLFSAVPTIIISVRAEEADIVRALEWGADDFLAKPFRQTELIARLKAQLRKQPSLSEEAPMVYGSLRYDPSTSQATYDGREISLTVVEGQILGFLMRHAGHVVTHSRLAELLWGEDYPGAVDGLRVHIRRLRAKIEADPSNPQLIRTKSGVGYSLASPR